MGAKDKHIYIYMITNKIIYIYYLLYIIFQICAQLLYLPLQMCKRNDAIHYTIKRIFFIQMCDVSMITQTIHSLVHMSLKGHTGFLYSPYHHNDEIQQVPAIPQVRIRMTQQPICNNFQKRLHRKNDQKEILHPFLDRQNREKEDISSLIASSLISLNVKPPEALNQHQKMY